MTDILVLAETKHGLRPCPICWLGIGLWFIKKVEGKSLVAPLREVNLYLP
jgi:hypothetical protein